MREPRVCVYASAYTHVPHARMGTGSAYMHTARTYVHREHMRVAPTHGRAHTPSGVACMVRGSVRAAALSTFCPSIPPPTHVSPGYRPLTLLGEFCLCSRRQQGCAATGTPLLRGRPQTGALPICPCTCVTPSQHELLPPSWLWPTNPGGLPKRGGRPLLPLLRGCRVRVVGVKVI